MEDTHKSALINMDQSKALKKQKTDHPFSIIVRNLSQLGLEKKRINYHCKEYIFVVQLKTKTIEDGVMQLK